MKGIKKKMLALFSAALLIMGSIVPVSAAEMTTFPTQSINNYTASYTRGIQVMLVNYSSTTRKYILNAGGADGSFGAGTQSGVVNFQSTRGLVADGICGKNTWSHFKSTLQLISTTSGYNTYAGNSPYYSNHYNMRQSQTSGDWQCYWNTLWKYVG